MPLRKYNLWSRKNLSGGDIVGRNFNFPIKRPTIGGLQGAKFCLFGRDLGGAKFFGMSRRNAAKAF